MNAQEVSCNFLHIFLIWASIIFEYQAHRLIWVSFSLYIIILQSNSTLGGGYGTKLPPNFIYLNPCHFRNHYFLIFKVFNSPWKIKHLRAFFIIGTIDKGFNCRVEESEAFISKIEGFRMKPYETYIFLHFQVPKTIKLLWCITVAEREINYDHSSW